MNLHNYSRLSLARKPDNSVSEPEAYSKQQLDFDSLISRYLSGESVQTLAAEAGKHRATIYRWMLAGLGDKDYHDVVTECLVTRIADADQRLETASDGCDIARAREMARFARMDFERRRPALYGQKQEITHISADLGDRLRRARERTIEGEIVDNKAQSVNDPALDQHTSVMSNTPALPKK